MLTKSQTGQALKRIAAILTERVPALVKANPCAGSAYAVLLCYHDLTVEEYTPVVIVGPESLRIKHEKRMKEEGAVWAPHQQITGLRELEFKDEELSTLCNAVYETISEDWGDREEQEVILPFRKMLYTVAKELNKLDWSSYLQVTDDFVVAAVHYAGCFPQGDVPASVPEKKKKQLIKAGWLADDSLAGLDPELRAVITVMQAIDALPPKERAIEALRILDLIHRGQPAGPYTDQFELIRTIENTNKVGLHLGLQFIAARAGRPPYSDPKRDQDNSPAQMLRILLWSLGIHRDPNPEAEALLRSIIRNSLPYARHNKEVVALLNIAAKVLHDEFKGYPKPAGSGDWSLIKNIDEFLA